jgi:hypothetical protein
MMAQRWLAAADGTPVGELLALAGSDSPFARSCVARASTPAVADTLRRLAGDADPYVRGQAADALAGHGGDVTAAALVPLLGDPACAAGAARSLGACDSPAVVDRVREWAASDPTGGRWTAAAGALAGMSSPEATALLLDHVGDARDDVRVAAAAALAGRGGREVTEALVARLEDDDPAVRRAAAAALGPAGGDPGPLAALAARLSDADAAVREAAAGALELSDAHPEITSAVLALLADDDAPNVREAVMTKVASASAPSVLTGLCDLAGQADDPSLILLDSKTELLAERAFRALSDDDRRRVRAGLVAFSYGLVASGRPIFTADLVDDEFLDTEIVIQLRGGNRFGAPVYSYLLVLGRNLKRMFVAMGTTVSFKPSDFALVLLSDVGPPPDEITRAMNARHNLVPVDTRGYGG